MKKHEKKRKIRLSGVWQIVLSEYVGFRVKMHERKRKIRLSGVWQIVLSEYVGC